jgi:hypothetical protein
MPSPAAIAFLDALVRGRTLSSLAKDPRLRPISLVERRIYLHAALASYVAAWESYIERLVGNIFTDTSDPLLAKFRAGWNRLRIIFILLLGNSRELLANFTGYDPINDWTWPVRRMSGPIVRARLNEILHVRHSFAHGFAMPSYAWNTSSAGEVRLTIQNLRDTDAFFLNLVRKSDLGMRLHLQQKLGGLSFGSAQKRILVCVGQSSVLHLWLGSGRNGHTFGWICRAASWIAGSSPPMTRYGR